MEPVSSEGGHLGLFELLHWNTLLITGALFIALVSIATFSKFAQSETPWLSILLLFLAVASLLTAADFFVKGAQGLARRAGIAEVVIGLTVVSIGTSLPEILVTVTASWGASTTEPLMSDFAIGNIYGSVLVQITLILGLVVMFKPLDIRPSWLRRDGLLMLLSVILLSIFLWTDHVLQRWEGAVLVSSYVLYIIWLLTHSKEIQEDEMEMVEETARKERGWSTAAYFVMVVFGLAIAVYAANQLVGVASELAISMNVPHAVVGTTISAIGTSLPELGVALMAARRSQGVAIGTLIGSNITDPLLSIGLGAILNPMAIASSGGMLLNIIVPATILGVVLSLMLMWSDFKFNRNEGLVLCAFYALFILVLEGFRRGYILAWW